MKILVCISNVPDTTTKIAFTPDGKALNKTGVQFIINPYDEWYALVRALELKEASGAGAVTLIHVGPAENDAIIRKGLAIGADDAVRIDADPADAYFVAEQVAAYAKDKAYDLILTGKETIETNSSLVGGMLAEMLNLPFVSLASKLDVAGNVATVENDVDGGTAVLEVQLPAVISCQKGMAEARIPNMRGIMAARTKPLAVVAVTNPSILTSVESFTPAEGRKAVKMIDPNNMDELVSLLHNEAKVI
ncbi:MAG TPA: electron transfer flavoprotein subunit beta/FixA family protein [Bacteroidia bacterium]|jgi:electron transfer flavoprotein beta subunit|nr:electron transfer flavoprotein subunit beta/FixA family protein [Bacteroidia bacterium]